MRIAFVDSLALLIIAHVGQTTPFPFGNINYLMHASLEKVCSWRTVSLSSKQIMIPGLIILYDNLILAKPSVTHLVNYSCTSQSYAKNIILWNCSSLIK